MKTRTSKRKFEGCLTIDHRDSPGTTAEQLQGLGPVVPNGEIFKAPTVTCVHCQRIVIINPMRTRPRSYCQKCDDYQCDHCAALECRPFAKVIDTVLERASKGLPIGDLWLP